MLIKGKTILLHERVELGADGFGNPVYGYSNTSADNILINTLSGTELINADDFNGRKQLIQICVPINDTHNWEGSELEWRGHRYKVIGAPKEGDDDKMPLAWNKIYTGERYE